MAGAKQTERATFLDPKNNTIDHIAQLLTELDKDNKYTKRTQLASDQWKKTLNEMERLRSKEEIKSSQKMAEREQEKDVRIRSLEQHVRELTNRLSEIAGNRMSEGNSEIADLSDPYRPTKLAEMFKEVYNEEWMDAFQYYDSKFRNEERVLDALAFFPKDIYDFCRTLFEQQSERLEGHMQYMIKIMTEPIFTVDQHNNVHGKTAEYAREANKKAEHEGRILVKKLQKSMANSSVRNLYEIYRDVESFKRKPEWIEHVLSSEALRKFISKLLGIIWLMMSQDPPMALKSLEPGTKMDKTSFIFYMKSGDIVQRTVWPAVYLQEKGTLLTKGVIQTK